jgi:hypothetical protein
MHVPSLHATPSKHCALATLGPYHGAPFSYCNKHCFTIEWVSDSTSNGSPPIYHDWYIDAEI